MSRTQYYCAATLDGYIADADDGLAWLLGYEGEYAGENGEPGPMGPGNSYERFYDGVGALVSGSATYEFIVEHMGDGGEWPYPNKPYWVLSTRELPIPDGPEVDVRVVDAAVPELAAEMRASAGARNLWIVGGGNVASQFAAAGLLEDVIVTVVPVVLGEGKPIFDEPLPGGPLRLEGTTTYASGMVELRFSVTTGA